jgi:hypothetical protein
VGNLQIGGTRAEVSEGSNQLLVSKTSATVTSATTAQLRIARTVANGVPTVPANAGTNRTDVEPFETVTLDASATNGSTYSWARTSATGGENPSLTGGSTAVATYTAPANIDGTSIVWTVTANGSDTDAVTHTVLPHNFWKYDGSAWDAVKLPGAGT